MLRFFPFLEVKIVPAFKQAALRTCFGLGGVPRNNHFIRLGEALRPLAAQNLLLKPWSVQ